MKETNTYRGVIVPMVTPLNANHQIDEEGVQNIVSGLVKNCCDVFVLGTTGEAVLLSQEKKSSLVEKVVKIVSGDQRVYAGISSNCYENAIEQASRYYDLGADVLVAHLPYFYPIDDSQILRYYEKLADEIPLPLVLYNIPATTNLSIPLAVIEKLSYHDNIIAFKDSERNQKRLDMALEIWKERTDFSFHLGWATQSLYALCRGLHGIVPSSGNLIPEWYRKVYDAVKSDDMEEAKEAQQICDEISSYYQKDRILSKAIPCLKLMLKAYGFCEAYVSSPMLTLSERAQHRWIDHFRKNFFHHDLINTYEKS